MESRFENLKIKGTLMNNSLIIAYKPPFISSNAFLSKLKRKYNAKKGGFSGTLDPFARGCLIVAFGQYTKLLPFLQTTPKTYNATLWLGAESKSLDIENFLEVQPTAPLDLWRIRDVFASCVGEISYTPPAFSAKKINGIRSYKIARQNLEVALKSQVMNVVSLKLLSYNHPFIHFQAKVSKGAYIRSLGEIIAHKLNTKATLSSLERKSEGEFEALPNAEIKLNAFEVLPLQELKLDLDYAPLVANGAKIQLKNLKNEIYKVKFDSFFSIIQINDGNINYLLNRIHYAHTL